MRGRTTTSHLKLFSIALLTVIALAGCAGSRATSGVLPAEQSVREPGAGAPAATVALEAHLRDEILTWEGTPHRWGGDSRAGIDCSAFVMRVYADALDVRLPRTTEAQAQVGNPISPAELAAGDLVFFRTGPKTRHVGIYLSDGHFAHAGTTEGVTISELGGRYWQRTYWMSRRILTPQQLAEVVKVAPLPEEEGTPTAQVESARQPQLPHPPRHRRTGW